MARPQLAGASRFPRVVVVEEGPRDGLQIESVAITAADKVRLVDALSRSGLSHIVVGAFVSPRWTPQMADVEDVIVGMTPRPGVEYRALALNAKGVERRQKFSPPLTIHDEPRTIVHACDVFVRRNTNRSQADEIAAWPGAVARARERGANTATIALNAGFGSNWLGEFTHDYRMDLLARQWELWHANGIAVTKVWLGDPMGWNLPTVVEDLLVDIQARWPEIGEVHLHLHNTRGCALTSAYAALRTLDPARTLTVDTAIGGIGGCPYCGNGRATGMIATEDFVDLLHELGVPTGIDLDALIEASVLASEIVGRPLEGKVAKAGPRPRGTDRYAMDMPFIETFTEASHFRRGAEVYAQQRSPWAEPITNPARDQTEADTRPGTRADA